MFSNTDHVISDIFVEITRGQLSFCHVESSKSLHVNDNGRLAIAVRPRRETFHGIKFLNTVRIVEKLGTVRHFYTEQLFLMNYYLQIVHI